jgi:group I intron endonuclease
MDNSVNNIVSGVYSIKNMLDGKVYIGSTVNLKKRWRSHKYMLKNNKHDNRHLQFAWNKYGADAFVYSVVEYVALEVLFVREKYYILFLKSNEDPYGYNIDIPDENGYRICTEETKRLISKASKGRVSKLRGRPLSEEHKKNVSLSHIGKKMSDEAKKQMSLSQTGRKHSEESKKKISMANLGKIVSDETRRKQSVCKKGRIINAEWRRKLSEAGKKRRLTEDHKKRISEARSKWWANKGEIHLTAEHKKKISDMNKLAHERKRNQKAAINLKLIPINGDTTTTSTTTLP